MVDMPPRVRFPSYYPRFPLFAGSVRLVVNRGRRLRRFEKDAPRAALRFAASLLVLCLFILYLFLCRTRALNIGGGIDGTDHSQISDSPQLDLLVILRVGDRHLDILIPQRPRR